MEDLEFPGVNPLVLALIAAAFSAGSNLASVRMYATDALGRPLSDHTNSWSATRSVRHGVNGVLCTKIENQHTAQAKNLDYFFPFEELAKGIDVTLKGWRL